VAFAVAAAGGGAALVCYRPLAGNYPVCDVSKGTDRHYIIPMIENTILENMLLQFR